MVSSAKSFSSTESLAPLRAYVVAPLRSSFPNSAEELILSYAKSLLLELAFDDTFVKPFQWSSFAQAYSRVLHDQDFPKRVAMDVYYNV